MPTNRLFYTVKLNSSLLKEYNYNLNISFSQCIRSGLIVSLADSQMLKSIRNITNKCINLELLEEYYKERDELKKKKNSKLHKQRIKELQDLIYEMMYIPEYITVVMDSIKDYEHIFQKGFIFNNKKYVRISCSASQARVSTIAFCTEDIKDVLKTKLDNGRNLNKPLAPSKYNAYFGLYSSAIKQVRRPRFCIIPDYIEKKKVDVDYIIETDKEIDDIIEPRTEIIDFNRFDGSGLISPDFAKKWAEDLKEDYIPCQFCIRSAFTKGMVNEFDFVNWCKEYNNDNYYIKDIYGKTRDLREIDLILTEGMTKLWDSWETQENFEQCCKENGIVWGITKYSPKKDKEVLITNYQFLQTLNLNNSEIEKVCQDTINFIQGVSCDNIYYSLLFMMGENGTPDFITKYMEKSDNYLLKSLILNHNLINDKYTKEKIRDMLIKRIEQACLGKLIVQGNFQCIVPDSFAFMQWATGQKVVGLLKEKEFYSQFWNNKKVTKIDCMRSPLTHFSEHYVVNLKNDELMKKWFKYSNSGIIVNCHDEHTMRFAGSDYDFDILATTNNEQFINNVYPNQRVVTYSAKKPQKKIFTENDLYKTDTFSFGTQIGQITNATSTCIGLMGLFEPESKEYKLLMNRVKMGCAAQSRQIDKTKIGEAVKGIPKIWTQYQKYLKDDTEKDKELKNFYNSLLTDRKPYFFKYKYPTLNKQLNAYIKKSDENCQIHFSVSLKDLLEKENSLLTEDEKEFIMFYRKFLPVIDSNCVMNNICKYIESIDFHIKQKIKTSKNFNYKNLLSCNNFKINKKIYKEIVDIILQTNKEWEEKIKNSQKNIDKINSKDLKLDKELEYKVLKNKLREVTSNEENLTDHLIYLFYEDKPSLNKATLWGIVGKQIFNNIKNNTTSYYFPIKNDNGTLEFLYNHYSIERFVIEK